MIQVSHKLKQTKAKKIYEPRYSKQNNLANEITHDITANIRNNFRSMVCDDYIDISHKE